MHDEKLNSKSSYEENGRISQTALSTIFQSALKTPNLITKEDTAVIFYDLSLIESRVRTLQSLFPANTNHAIAIKANPLGGVLRRLASFGTGLEAASLPELYLALNAGVSPNKIVFDSPAKTRQELKFALDKGCMVNADNLDELQRIDDILQTLPTSSATVGIRINPQVGMGKIASTSVAGYYSKFGVPLSENREELIACYLRYPWLSGIHCHIGSQGVSIDMLVSGARALTAFIEEIEEALITSGQTRRITHIDIGGGFPVTYHREDPPLNIADYVTALQQFDTLFAPEVQLTTEFGRWINANAGWTVSQVEYVKHDGDKKTAMIHVGADMFLRECYRPEDWHHEVTVLDALGQVKKGSDNTLYTLAGPLCFSGDMIARDIPLPVTEENDHILIEDTGAYTLAMWSRYNSRQIPKVVGYETKDGSFSVLRERESPQCLIDFWG